MAQRRRTNTITQRLHKNLKSILSRQKHRGTRSLGKEKGEVVLGPRRTKTEQAQLRAFFKSYRLVALADLSQEFYHGSPHKFDEIEGPAWFAGKKHHSINYMQRERGQDSDSNTTYLYTFKPKRVLVLVDLRFSSYAECMLPLPKMEDWVIRRRWAFYNDKPLTKSPIDHATLMDFARDVSRDNEKPVAQDLFIYQTEVEGVKSVDEDEFSGFFMKFQDELKARGIDGWIAHDEGTEVMLMDPANCLTMQKRAKAKTDQDYEDLDSDDLPMVFDGGSMLEEVLEEFPTSSEQDQHLSFIQRIHNARCINTKLTPDELEDCMNQARRRWLKAAGFEFSF